MRYSSRKTCLPPRTASRSMRYYHSNQSDPLHVPHSKVASLSVIKHSVKTHAKWVVGGNILFTVSYFRCGVHHLKMAPSHFIFSSLLFLVAKRVVFISELFLLNWAVKSWFPHCCADNLYLLLLVESQIIVVPSLYVSRAFAMLNSLSLSHKTNFKLCFHDFVLN